MNASVEELSASIDSIAQNCKNAHSLAKATQQEAARAGEHGLGFSVVADEVRKFAERSSQATKEISKLINESVKRVTQGGVVSKQAAEAFEKIVVGVSKTTQAISEISVSSQEQQTAARDVSSVIQHVAEATEKSAQASELIAQGTKDLGIGSDTLAKNVEKFST